MKAKPSINGRPAFGRVFLLLGALFLFAGCVMERSPVTGKKRAYGSSWKQELQMGQAANQQLIQQYGLYDDPEVQAYVEHIGQRVLAESDLRKPDTLPLYRETPIRFQVLDSPVVNAFAVPGYVYVTRGLLAHLENEAQLAVVLGHEIGHIAARHISQQALQQQWAQLGLFAGAMIGSQVIENPNLASQVMDLGQAATQLLTRKYSRDDERESDLLGVQYAAAKGYAIEEAAGFFNTLDRLRQQEKSTMPSWMATHPDPGQREQTILQLARKYQPPDAMPVVGQNELFNRLEGLVVGENPREGFVKDDVFYHPELAFQFPVPRGWQVANERAAVIMVAPNGAALLKFGLSPAKTAREGAARFAQSQSIQVLGSEPTTVGGAEAFVLRAAANTGRGPVDLLNYFIESDARVYHFIGMTPRPQYRAVLPSLMQVMTGFERLEDPDLRNVQPVRMGIVTVDRPAPFIALLPLGPMGNLTPEDLAIMNQRRLDEVVPAGTKLKLPQ